MFDFNGDGRTDTGEQFTGYQIFTDTTKGFTGKSSGIRLDGYSKVIIALVVWQVINLIFGGGR